MVSPGISKASIWAQWLIPFPGGEHRAVLLADAAEEAVIVAFSYPVCKML